MASKLFQSTLRGRTTAITGASGGIGLAIAERFLHEGSSVILLGRDAQKLKAAASQLPHDDRIRKHVLDVRLEQSWAEAIPLFPDVDILINCAGISQRSLLVRTGENEIRDILDTNLVGTILGCRAVARHWLKSKRRHEPLPDYCIINLSSLLGVRGCAGTSVYSGSKAGIIGLTTSLAAEFRGTRVNAILPGYIDTAMTNASTPDGNPDADTPQKMKIPVARFGTPDEVADAAVFLAKNKYANNCILNLDGGLSAT